MAAEGRKYLYGVVEILFAMTHDIGGAGEARGMQPASELGVWGRAAPSARCRLSTRSIAQDMRNASNTSILLE